MAESGYGYDTKLFVETPSELFICPLCFNILKDLKSCPNGHCCCGGCFAEAIERRPECPMCKVSLTSDKLSRNLLMEKMIRDLKMICISCENLPAGEVGCKWTGVESERTQHYETNCEFYRIRCPTFGCSDLIYRRQLFDHLSVACAARSVPCPDCRAVLPFRELQAHQIVCPKRLVGCPNGCGLRSTFMQITTHYDTDCPLQIVKCPLFELQICHENCKGSLSRSCLVQHCANQVIKIKDTAQHYETLLKDQAEVKTYVTVITEKCKQMDEKSNRSEQEVETLKTKLAIMESKVTYMQLETDQLNNRVKDNQKEIQEQKREIVTQPDLVSHPQIPSVTVADMKNIESNVTKYYVAVSWRQMVIALTKALVPVFPKNSNKHSDVRATLDKNVATALLWNAIELIHLGMSAETGSPLHVAVNAVVHHFSKLVTECKHPTEPTPDHRAHTVGKIILRKRDGLVVFVCCVCDFGPEWQSYSSLRSFLSTTQIEQHPNFTLYDLMLHSVLSAVHSYQRAAYAQSAETYMRYAGQITLSTTSSGELNAMQDRLDLYVNQFVEYRNKKMKWIPGVLASVSVSTNSCIVLNKSDELVTVKLSNCVRFPEYSVPPALSDTERFALLQVGDNVEFCHRGTKLWCPATIVTINKEEMACTVSTGSVGKQSVFNAIFSELRDVL